MQQRLAIQVRIWSHAQLNGIKYEQNTKTRRVRRKKKADEIYKNSAVLQPVRLCGIVSAVAGLNRFMYITFSPLRLAPKAISVALLWLMSVSFSVAMPASGRVARFYDSHTAAVKKLVFHPRAASHPDTRTKRTYGIRRHPLRCWVQRQHAPTASDDDVQAIQNDTVAAVPSAELDIALEKLGAFDDPIEPRASEAAFTPRSPRGPPAGTSPSSWSRTVSSNRGDSCEWCSQT